MKTLSKILTANVFILLAFIFSSCEQTTEPIVNITPNETADATLDKANPERPFKGNVLYTLTDADQTHLYLSGTGNLTHLGKCTTLETIYLVEGFGEDTFTAADGSRIHMIWNPVGDDTFTWKIDGGTGRFEGATGSGICPPVVENPNGTLAIEFIGVIKY